MNTTRTTTAKTIEKIGNIAAYSFWITATILVLTFSVVIYSYGTPEAYRVGQFFAAVGSLMFLSIGVMVSCAKILKARGEY